MNKNEVLKKVKLDGQLSEVPIDFRKDKEVVLLAVKQNGYALYYADTKLKKDKEIVLAAVKKDGGSLQYADEKLRKDKKVVLEAVKKDGYALEYADEKLRKDKKVVLEAVKKAGYALNYADQNFRKNKEIILSIINDKNQSSFGLEIADESFKKDKKIVLAAVKKDGTSLRYADESLKKDKKIVLAAVKQESYALEYADKSLKKDKDILAIINKTEPQKINKKEPSNNYIDKKLKDKFGIYAVLLVHNSEGIMYRENVTPIKKIKIKPFEYWIEIKKKDLKNLTYKKIYNFVKNMIKDKTITNRVQNLKIFLKTNNTLYQSGIWNDDNDDEVLNEMLNDQK